MFRILSDERDKFNTKSAAPLRTIPPASQPHRTNMERWPRRALTSFARFRLRTRPALLSILLFRRSCPASTPPRFSGEAYAPTQSQSRRGWRSAWRTLTAKCGLKGLRPDDLRHRAITKLAESADAREQTIMSIADHDSVEMLRYYSYIRQEAKRKAVASLDISEITSQLDKWKKNADDERRNTQLIKGNLMVGTGRFELPTPRTPSECSTRLSHVPTQDEPVRRGGPVSGVLV